MEQVKPQQEIQVVGFLFNENHSHAVFVKKKWPAWQKNKLNGVGGHVLSGESPEMAMRRKFYAETGLLVTDWEEYLILEGGPYRLHVFRSTFRDKFHVTYHGDPQEMLHPYTTPLEAAVRSNGGEMIMVTRISDISLYPTAYVPNLKWIVPMALDGDLRTPIRIYDINIDHSRDSRPVMRAEVMSEEEERHADSGGYSDK